ncbi:MAG: serine/threonine-protein kinase [Phycisphaerales bacterium]|nr:serine/threonine-protein kinase [Phycisphaerales bacterium]
MSDTPSYWFSTEGDLIAELKVMRGSNEAPAIAGYEELAEIRRGGQGVVYRATQAGTHRTVAIKLMHASGAPAGEARRRFEREVDLVAALRHPQIVSVYDSGTATDGRPYLVMEYVDGQSLDEHLRAMGPASARDTRRIVALFIEISEGVQFAHQRGVIHRDLKPSNIRVDRAGRARVLDFGLAKGVRDTENSSSQGRAIQRMETISGSGQFLGSLAWASPEQAAGESRDLDVRTDVYSLGVMMYHALSGEFPYDVSGTLREVLENIEKAAPRSLRLCGPEIDDELATIVMHCLAKERERRYASAGELAVDLRRYLAGEAISAKGDSSWYTIRKSVRRHRAAFVVASAGIVGLAVFGVTMSLLYARAAKAERTLSQRVVDLDRTSTFLRDTLNAPDPAKKGRDARVLDVVLIAAKKIEADDAMSSAARAGLKSTLGVTFTGLGQYADSVRLLRGSLDDFAEADAEAGDGSHFADVVRTEASLAYALYRDGKLEDATKHATHAYERAQGLSPEARASSLTANVMAFTRFAVGDLPGAEKYLREQIELSRAVGTDEALAVAGDAAGNLGIILRQLDRYDEAEALYRAELKRAGDADTAGVARIVNSLGSVMHSRGNVAEAERLYIDAIARSQRTLGPAHDDTLAAMGNLALLYAEHARLADAEELQRKIILTCEQTLGDENPITLMQRHNLAKTLEDQGKLPEAEALLRATIELRTKVLGAAHSNTLVSLGNLGGVLAKQGRRDDALEISKRVYELLLAANGEERLETVLALNNLAISMQNAGQVEQALPLAQRAAAACEKALGATHWRTELLRGNLGRCLLKLDRPADAEPLLRASLDAIVKQFGPDHAIAKQTRGNLADALTRLNRADEAAALEK